MYSGVLAILPTGSHRETVDFPLRNECCMRSDPRLVDVEMLHRILLFMLPFHMFLFVSHRIPPDVQQAISPDAAMYEEGAKVETGAVLWDYKIDGVGSTVACR